MSYYTRIARIAEESGRSITEEIDRAIMQYIWQWEDGIIRRAIELELSNDKKSD